MWRIPALAAVLVVTLAVPACSGSSSGATSLPGTREFGLNDQEFADHVERTETLVASCMERAGFEYVPVDVATLERAQASVRKEPGLSDREYRQKWGLAVTTRFDDPKFIIGLGANADAWNKLQPAARTAYRLTLQGPNQDSDFAVALDDEDFSETGGCTREAVSQVFTPDQLTGSYVNPKDGLVDQDPRMRDARDKWSTCMQDQGYTYKDDEGSIIDDFKKRLAALVVGDEDPTTLTGEKLDKLHALQAEEIKVSVAGFDCSDKYVLPVEAQVETEVFGHPLK